MVCFITVQLFNAKHRHGAGRPRPILIADLTEKWVWSSAKLSIAKPTERTHAITKTFDHGDLHK